MCSKERSSSPGGQRSRGAGCSAMRSRSTWRGTRGKTSPKPWIEFAPSWDIRQIDSFHRPPVASWSEASGDIAGRGLVGRSTRPYRIWSWIWKAGCRRAGGCLEPQSNRYCGVHAADQQPSMGQRTGECLSVAPPYRAPAGLGGQRLSDCDAGSGASYGARLQAPARQVGTDSRRG